MSNLIPGGVVFSDSRTYHFGCTTYGGHMATFAEKLKQLRAKAELTQEGLARKIDMSVGIVRDYEQGKRTPSLRAAFKLADALGVDVKVFKDCMGQAEAEAPPAKKKRKRKGE